jgi:ATP-binding cassette subfamily C protein
VRLDDAELKQWSDADLGRHLGYLPQDTALLDATIEENIARLEDNPDPRAIVEAARAAGIHEMVVRMRDGYAAQLGPLGTALSGGQRQRIGLARALFGQPFLVVLDEPNSNLDTEGEAALTRAIEGIRKRGGIAIIVAHRPSALAAVDLVAVMNGGQLAGIGPKDEVLRNFVRKVPVAAAS